MDEEADGLEEPARLSGHVGVCVSMELTSSVPVRRVHGRKGVYQVCCLSCFDWQRPSFTRFRFSKDANAWLLFNNRNKHQEFCAFSGRNVNVRHSKNVKTSMMNYFKQDLRMLKT